jgi:hypothetical protein
MNINKLAATDAAKWARAEMFFGEGAGTRRKLLDADITHKSVHFPGYGKAFDKAYEKQNFADHAIRAAKERKRLDRSHTLGKNVRALARGDRRGMSNGFAAVVIVVAVAKFTGYDKVALDKGKVYHSKLKVRIAEYKLAHNHN